MATPLKASESYVRMHPVTIALKGSIYLPLALTKGDVLQILFDASQASDTTPMQKALIHRANRVHRGDFAHA